MDVSELNAGDDHYMSYVGPPDRYDFMGATQFRLLTSLGLRSHHSLLDVGCGSLRAGKFFIQYLEPGNYFGIEPNAWLIEEAIKSLIGDDLIRLKKPAFDHNSDFDAAVFDHTFDYMVAQSIFSHTGRDLVHQALSNMEKVLHEDGRIVATFVHGVKDFEGSGWIYPECVKFRSSSVVAMAKSCGLYARRIPWYHPFQQWYVLAKTPSKLPSKRMNRYLKGSVLYDTDFQESWRLRLRMKKSMKNYLSETLPESLQQRLKKLLSGRR